MPPKLTPDSTPGSASRAPEPSPAAAGSLVGRFRQRLFQPWAPRQEPPAAASLPVPVTKRQAGLQSSIAEFLLVNRLHARRCAASSADVMARASRIVFVTCQNWFGTADTRSADQHQQHQHKQTRR